MADTRHLAALSDHELERALRRLGRRIDFPTTPDLASSVRARIADGPVAQPGRLVWFAPRRGLVTAAIVLLLMLAGTLALFSGARDAVADLFGVRGIQITIERDAAPTTVPAPAISPVGPDLSLGREVTLAEARDLAPYDLHVPDLAAYGEPDEVYLRTLPDGNTMVSLIYYPAAGLPEAEETGVGALLMQFDARDDVAYIGKGISYGSETAMRRVDVNNADGWWIAGATMVTIFEDPSTPCCLPGRPSANILLWEQDRVTFRLESSLTESSAIMFAESIEEVTEEGS
ncbi:MAG: hypothetical protein ACRDJW_11575 [Thermomicrobiales bacterium]